MANQESNNAATVDRANLGEARRREKITQAEWRRQRAEVARLVAAGEEAAARKLLAQVGLVSPSPTNLKREALPDADVAQEAAVARMPESVSGDTSYSEPEARAERVQKESAKPKAQIGKADPGGITGEKPRRQSAAGPKKPARTASAKAKAERLTRAVKPSRRKRRPPKTWKAWFQNRPPWATSLAVHSVLIVAFGLMSFASLGEPAFSLSLAMEDDAWDEMPAEVTLVDFQSEAEPEEEPTEAAPDLSQTLDLAGLMEPAQLEPVDFEPADSGDTLAISTESLAAEAAAATGGGDAGQGEAAKAVAAKPTGKPGKVSFFGAESRANRVVFVVDNSGSMQRGRMETTLMELDRAVSRLSTSQQFYVIFYSDQAYPMFFPKSVDAPIQATRPNKRKLNQWLHTVEMCLGGRLLDAMELAAGLEPEVVFLLSDGDIRSQRVTERMTDTDAWDFTIHTLGMGARTPQHAKLLMAIATSNGGVFRLVQAHPQAVARSRIKPIPYHRETGTAWGSAVTPWQ